MKWKNLTAREVIRILKDDGWSQVGSRGSHLYFKHPSKPGKISVPVHKKETLKPKTIRSIFMQARLVNPEEE
jgi:predicted RNA binding protein YcfA (HicA-like mRNA interferase family)